MVYSSYGEALGLGVDEVEGFVGIFGEVYYPPVDYDADNCLEN